MAREIEDNREAPGRRETSGDAAKQDSERQDSDRSYGARDSQRESGQADKPDRGKCPD